MIREIAVCVCGERTSIPPHDEWTELREEVCQSEHCGFLNRCQKCRWQNFLSRYCSCNCGRCRITEMHEVEIDESNQPDFGLFGVSRIPKGERWNVALGEYCRTTGEVEKYRKEQGKHYVSDDEPPKPYEPSSSEESKKKRREFAKQAFDVEVKYG